MVRTVCFTLLCGSALLSAAVAQEVDVGRKVATKYPKAEAVASTKAKSEMHVEKAIAVQPAKSPTSEPRTEITSAAATTKKPIAEAPVAAKKTAVATTPARKIEKETPAIAARSTLSSVVSPVVKPEAAPTKLVSASPAVAQISKTEPVKKETAIKVPAAATPKAKIETASVRPLEKSSPETQSATAQTISFQGDTAFIKLADGFDFPIGKPDAQGYYKARGFRSRGHLGEDWDGVGGGDTDLGDSIFSIGDGVVVFARDVHMGWGNCIIVRHTYREGGAVKNIDALYGHLNSMLVRRGQAVSRGQKIATMGNAHGLYDAHLHLEIRKNLEIGMSRAAFARDFSNYFDPSQFIAAHRHLSTSGGTYRVALNTFTRDAKINFEKARNYSHSHYKGGTGESATALKKTLASQH